MLWPNRRHCHHYRRRDYVQLWYGRLRRYSHKRGLFHINSDCQITHNSAKNGYGGINWEAGNHSAFFSVSGSTVVEDNKANGIESNVCLGSGKYINVEDSLTSGASIGVTMQTPGVFTNSSNTSCNDASEFTSDNASYAVGKNADGQLYLGTACVVTYEVVNGTWSDDTTAAKTETVASGSTPASVPTDMKPAEGYTGGAWDTDPSGASVTEATTFTYTFEEKQLAVVKAAPSANTLTYSGSAQELVSAGTAEGGTMQYALGTDATTAPTDGWATSVPTGTDAGTCYVWYKAAGDDSHTDTEPVSVSVTIEKKEVGLSWSDTSFTYDVQPHVPTATATGLVDGDTCTVTVEGKQTDAGTYTATATALSNDNYRLPDSCTTSFQMKKADPGTPQVTMQGYTYGGTLSTPSIGDYADGGAVSYYYSDSDSNSDGTKWTDSMSATSLDPGTWYVYAVIAPAKNHLGYTTEATRFEVAPGVVTVSGSIHFGNYTGNLTISLLSGDGEETVATDSIRVSGGKGTYHFEHITQGQYILCTSWTEGKTKSELKTEIKIR